MPVSWEALDAKSVEDLVSSLLNVLYPDRAQRIDGIGGDDGQDVQLTLADGVHAFEIKSHTGRIRSNRRRQVERSLARAVLLSPESWTLLVPLDPNPTELKWFEQLQKATPFPISWRGRTWLDTELAKRPYLERYWVHTTADELKHLLEMARQEEAGLAEGAVDAVERARRVVELLNESNPFWRFEITTDGESSSVRPIPRYRGADRDAPITFSVTFAFPNTPEARVVANQLRAAFDFGTVARIPADYIREVVVDAPIPLVPREGAKSIEIGPSQRVKQPVPMLFGVSAPDGTRLGELPISMVVTSRGERGAKLEGTDRSGIIQLEMTLDAIDQRMRVNISVIYPKTAFFANEVRDATRVVKHALKPNLLEFQTLDASMTSRGESPFDEPFVEDGFDGFLDDLVLLQWASGLNRPVGPGFSNREVVEVEEAARLLRGETLEGTWTFFETTLGSFSSDEARRDLAAGPHSLRIVGARPQVATVTGTAYAVGEMVEHTFESAVFVPGEGYDPAEGPQVDMPLRFVPGTSDKMTRRLVKAEAASMTGTRSSVGGRASRPRRWSR